MTKTMRTRIGKAAVLAVGLAVAAGLALAAMNEPAEAQQQQAGIMTGRDALLHPSDRKDTRR